MARRATVARGPGTGRVTASASEYTEQPPATVSDLEEMEVETTGLARDPARGPAPAGDVTRHGDQSRPGGGHGPSLSDSVTA